MLRDRNFFARKEFALVNTKQADNYTEPLDDFFETCGLRIFTALRKIIRAVDVHSRKLNRNFNITAPQMICLYCLGKNGKMTQSRLSRTINIGISTVNGIIDRLEKKGLVLRQRDTKDRRKVFISITDS